MRIVHISDIHLQARYFAEYPHRFLGKRLAGLINLTIRGRSRLFREAPVLVRKVFERVQPRSDDQVVVSGDLTALGLTTEMSLVLDLLRESMGGVGRLTVVPGNHDLYTLDIVWSRAFERFFSPQMTTDLPDYLVEGELFPFVRFFGEDVALIGVNSAKPNPIPWYSSGRIGNAQRERLSSLLADPRVCDKFIIIMTHFGPFRADGRPDTILHGLSDRDQFLSILQEGNIGGLIHGHIHENFHIPASRMGFPIYSAGSTTYHGRASFNIYTIEGRTLSTEAFKYDTEAEQFVSIGSPKATPFPRP